MRSNDPWTTEKRDRTSADRGQVLLDIANTIVRLHKQFYGKGPTKARAHLSQELVTVVLEGGFTRSEHTLAERGHEREVLELRSAMQRSVETEFRSAIEEVTGRSVRSFMSANDPEHDIQVEVFVLQREDGSSDGAGSG
jgi:uncharacterized protein YbcI